MFRRKGPDGEPSKGLTLYQKLGLAAGGIGVLGFGAGVGVGVVLDQNILRPGEISTDTAKTTEQITFERTMNLDAEIKKLHKRSSAIALPT